MLSRWTNATHRPPFGAFLLPSLPDFVSRTRKDDAIRPYLALPRKIIENKSLTIRSSVSAIYQRRSLPDSSYQFPNENWQTSFFFFLFFFFRRSIVSINPIGTRHIATNERLYTRYVTVQSLRLKISKRNGRAIDHFVVHGRYLLLEGEKK